MLILSLLQEFGNATVVEDNPVGRQAVATLPGKPFWTTGSLDGNVVGSLSVKSSANGIGVDYTVSFSNLPKEGGPFRKSEASLYTASRLG
jgi:hypothetical protein